MTTKLAKENAFVLIDKPLNLSSFDIIRQLRKQTGIKKMGHTGTLDPLATGLMLVAFGKYTKLIPYFEKDSKEYEFEFSLEGYTDSLDAETELIPADAEVLKQLENTLDEKQINEILSKNFSGEIEQVPPKYSALKIGGKKALERVRAGEEFEMKKRKVTIYNIELLSFEFPKITLRAKVSAGTYIRTIAGDLGNILGTGAYVTKLRRTKIGKLDLNSSQEPDNFDISKFLDIHELFSAEKFIKLPDEIITRLSHGQRVRNDPDIKPGEYFLESEGLISHVIEVDKYLLKMKRKI